MASSAAPASNDRSVPLCAADPSHVEAGVVDQQLSDRIPAGGPRSRTCSCCGVRCGKMQIIGCGVLAGIVLVVVAILAQFVLGPAIAKSAMAKAVISFDKLTISQPGDNYTFYCAADITVTHVAPLNCDVGELEITVLYKDRPFGAMSMPAMSLEAFKDNRRHIDSQLFTVTDRHVWNEFSFAMLHDKDVTWRLKSVATVTAHVMGMHVSFENVPFDKEMPLECFNGLSVVEMALFDLSHSTPDKAVVDMGVCVQNPSGIIITDLGQLYFGVYYNGSYMGNISAAAAAVPASHTEPSDARCTRFGSTAYNYLEMSGELHPKDHNMADHLISRYFSGQASEVSARALSPRADSLDLFNPSLQGLQLQTKLDGDETPLVTGLNFDAVMMTPIDDNHVKMDMVAAVNMQNPLGDNSPLTIYSVAMAVNMSYGQKSALVGSVRAGATTVPKPNVVHGTGTLKVPTTATMTMQDDGAALAILSKDLINKQSLAMAVDGGSDVVANCGALGYDMNIVGVPVKLPNTKAKPPLGSVIVPGMNGLPGVKILSYSIPGNVPDGTGGCSKLCGVKVSVDAQVNNTSPFGLVVGTLNAVAHTGDGTQIGTLSASGLALKPGENTIRMSGKLAAENPADLDAASKFMSAFLQGKSQPMKVVGTDAGDSPVKWLHKIVNGLELSASFPGADAHFSALADIVVNTLSMSLAVGSDPMVAGTVRARMQLPKEVDMSIIKDVDSSGMQFDMIDEASGVAVGSVSVTARVQYQQGGMITASFDTTPMVVKDANALSSLVKDLLLKKSKVVRMTGTAAPHATTNMGVMQLEGVPFTGTTTMYGLNGFVDPSIGSPEMSILSMDVSGGSKDALDLMVACKVTNPSNIAASMGKVSLELWTHDNFKIGSVTVDNFALNANEARNAVTDFPKVSGKYMPPTDSVGAASARRFLSQYLSGMDQTTFIRGAPDGSGTDIQYLKPALSAFKTSSVLPGMHVQLLMRGLMHLPNLLHPYDLPTILVVQNPFSVAMTLKSTYCEIYACKKFNEADPKKCKEYYQDPCGAYTPEPVNEELPGKGSKTLKIHAVKLHQLFSPEMIKTTFASAGNGSLIRLSGNMTVDIGGFTTTVDYNETDVPICLVYPLHNCDQFYM